MSTPTNQFVKDEEYSRLLIQNAEFHLKVRSGKANYKSNEWIMLQQQLTDIERDMSAKDIIAHAALLFPKVGVGQD
jgi:hypothetical protein